MANLGTKIFFLLLSIDTSLGTGLGLEEALPIPPHPTAQGYFKFKSPAFLPCDFNKITNWKENGGKFEFDVILPMKSECIGLAPFT